ncbi:hypothetical protein DIPPA_70110 [Diplonema papillatum]|nr:hypothetical protein DIPPA_70110 [Diplonema papillatum]
MSGGAPRFGVREGAGFTANLIEKGWKQKHPDWVLWQVGHANSLNPAPQGRPYGGARSPVDDPWTYKNGNEYQLYTSWQEHDPRPSSARDWQDILQQSRYTRYHSRDQLKAQFATKVAAGIEDRSKIDGAWFQKTKPKHDLRKPLSLLQKQRSMLNDSLNEGITQERSDTFLSPNLIAQRIGDTSAQSARLRMEAMKQWRSLRPGPTLRVQKSVILSSGLLSKLAAEELVAEQDELVSFDTFLQLYSPATHYYKLGNRQVPSSQYETTATAFPLGFAHTGIMGYAQGNLATGS